MRRATSAPTARSRPRTCARRWRSWSRECVAVPGRGDARGQSRPARKARPGAVWRSLAGAARTPDRARRHRARAARGVLSHKPRGRVRRAAALVGAARRRGDPQSRRVDALRLVDTRCARDRRAARGRGAPFRCHAPRAVAATLGDRRAVPGDDRGKGRPRLPRSARAPARAADGPSRAWGSSLVSAAATARARRRRLQRIAAALRERGLDAMLVTGQVNVRYLSGFTGSSGVVLVAADDRQEGSRARATGAYRFFTDFRYATQASGEVSGALRREVV